MTFNATAVIVLIASPSDTLEERDAVNEAIGQWNHNTGKDMATVAVPWRWEKDAIGVMGKTAQETINDQVEQSDIVFAIFNTRLGTATAAAESGTAEELKNAMTAGKPVHVYFSGAPITDREALDYGELGRLAEFKKTLYPKGLIPTYTGPEDLARQVKDALTHSVKKLGVPLLPPASKKNAVLKVTPTGPEDGRGKDIFVTNDSEIDVQDVTLTITTDNPAKPGPDVTDPETPVPITAGGKRRFKLNWSHAKTAELMVNLRWTENGEVATRRQNVSLNANNL
jgi:hypothetical protein